MVQLVNLHRITYPVDGILNSVIQMDYNDDLSSCPLVSALSSPPTASVQRQHQYAGRERLAKPF